MKNENPYGWKDEAIKNNSMVADRDYEIYALKERLRQYEPILPLTLLERAEKFFLRYVLAFACGMVFGMSVLIMRWAL